MVSEKQLADIRQYCRVEIVAAFVALSEGVAPVKVFEDLYEAGQQSVVDDPETHGLVRGMG